MACGSEKVMQAFRHWDVDGSGIIARRELLGIIKRLCPEIDDRDLDMLFTAAGVHGDGQLNYEEFLNWLWCDLSDAAAESKAGAGAKPEAEAAFGNFAKGLAAAEAAKERGLWEDALIAAREKAAEIYPRAKVQQYYDEVYKRLDGQEYIGDVKGTYFSRIDANKDGLVTFEEAAKLIKKSLNCAADFEKAPKPTAEEIRFAFDAHDTLADGRGRMGVDAFLNLHRYLQVRVAEAMLPLSQLVRGGC